ncbi:MAG: ABC transporter permease subunit [Candidatus Nanopelagicales bacterium]|nr:ABC transporter permease subunit [Candidatus Nanopelagicales bacterium]
MARMSRETRTGLYVAVPFALFIGLFLLYPTGAIIYSAFTPGDQLSLDGILRSLSGTYRQGFINSTVLAVTTALIGGVIGMLLAVVMRSLERPRWLHSSLDSWSAVASQLGGVPLAFAFIAAIGTQGLLTKVFAQVGININDLGVSPTGFWGLVIVYLYFQIPLMFLVSLPAINGLRRTWREAAAIMGASGARYWVRVGIPILTPAALGGMLLLFVNSFAAYATAYVLNPGGALVPLQIRFLLQGNVISGEEDLGYAIVTWVIGILMASLFLLTWLQRRTLRWTQS